MTTSDARITKAQAAKLTGTSTRQINRWAEAGLITVEYRGAEPGSILATYDLEEVRAAPEKWRTMQVLLREERRKGGFVESDIST